MTELLRSNLLSPIVLAFVLGAVARLVRSDLALPKDLYTALSIYLLFAIGLKGGVELSHADLGELLMPAAGTILLGVVTPLSAYAVLRRMGRFNVADAAGIAAHYGSVSAVTFIAALQFVERVGAPAEGYMPTLLTLLESPGIAVALAVGAVAVARERAREGGPPAPKLKATVHEVLVGRTMVLLVGGLLVGWLMGERGWVQVAPFFEGGFKGALTIFLLEMGVLAASRLSDLRTVGGFLLGFAILIPIVHGVVGVAVGVWSGLSVGGATVLGAMASSASYVAAPPAVRTTLPQANPTLSLTASLAITFPFNLVAGIPLYFAVARLLTRS
jgi:uncharacterized protein